MANQVLMTISRDEIESARLLSEYKYELDMQSKLVTAERKGKREGRKERDMEILEMLNHVGSLEELAQQLSRA